MGILCVELPYYLPYGHEGEALPNMPETLPQDRKQWLAEEGLTLKGKSLADQKKSMVQLLSTGTVSSVEHRLLQGLCPSKNGKIFYKADVKDFVAIYGDGSNESTQTFATLPLCVRWIAKQDSKSNQNEVSSSSSSTVSQPTLDWNCAQYIDLFTNIKPVSINFPVSAHLALWWLTPAARILSV